MKGWSAVLSVGESGKWEPLLVWRECPFDPVGFGSPAELSRGRPLRLEKSIVLTKTELRTILQTLQVRLRDKHKEGSRS